MEVFLTGATGYIGRTVAQALVERGHRVRGLARSAERAVALEEAGVTPVVGSLDDGDLLAREALAGDATIHAGATNDGRMGDVDAAATKAIASALYDTGKRFIYTSGCWYYGATGNAAATEETPADPPALVAWRPGVERIALESAARGVHAVVLRPGIVYGEHGGIPAMLLGSGKDGAIPFVGDGAQRWAVVHVLDLADLYVLALERAKAGTVYNGVAASESVRRIAEAASRIAGLGGRVTPTPVEVAMESMGPFAQALALDQVISSERAARELGWHPAQPTIIEDLAA